jgi:hypothetical protein
MLWVTHDGFSNKPNPKSLSLTPRAARTQNLGNLQNRSLMNPDIVMMANECSSF